MDATDAEIVQQCLAGQTRAFAVLVDRYKAPLYNVAFRMLKDADDAEDAAQCVFIRAYEKLESYRPEFKFFSWIYRMAVNESLNRIRAKRHHVPLEESPVPDPDPSTQLQSAELEERVGRALMGLKPEDRALILLRHFENLPYRDLGYIFEIPVKTVKSRLFTARMRLREICRGRGISLAGG
jgi:RNA polymerase sigma-70 factor, ECF subfamily